MFSRKQNDLLEYLYGHGVTSSVTLASYLNDSKRSVITYVKEINASVGGSPLILSSNRGYSLDQEQYEQMQNETREVAGDSPERIALLIRRLVNSYTDRLNIYDICEELHYSESTIRASFYKIRNIAKDYGLDIQLSYNTAMLVGSELSKRELYISLFQDEIERNMYDFSVVYEQLPQYSSDKLYQTFVGAVKQCCRQVDDYELVRLFYRLLIAMDRIAHGHVIRHAADEAFCPEYLGTSDREFGETVAREVGRITDISFPEGEILYLAESFASICIYSRIDDHVTPEMLPNEMWPGCYEMVESIIDEIRRLYGVDLRKDPEEYVLFALNVRTVIRRTHMGIRLRNPYLKKVRGHNSSVFDCAAYIAEIIGQNFHVRISEDDIACLALCLGHSFERDYASTKVRVLFVLPSYYNVHQNIYDYYRRQFGNFIVAEHTSALSLYGDLDEVDLIVSTLDLRNLGGKRLLQIGPLQSMVERSRFERVVYDLYTEKLHQNFTSVFRNLLGESRFCVCPEELKDREEALRFLTGPLKEAGILTEEGETAILRREELSGTARDGVALPHTMEYPANKDTMSLMVSDHAIRWGSTEVHVILLLTAEDGHNQNTVLKIINSLDITLRNRDINRKLLR